MAHEDTVEMTATSNLSVNSGSEDNNNNDDDKQKNDNEEEEETNGKKKKTIMKVAADAPWKDRMWEVFTTCWPLGFVAEAGALAVHAV